MLMGPESTTIVVRWYRAVRSCLRRPLAPVLWPVSLAVMIAVVTVIAKLVDTEALARAGQAIAAAPERALLVFAAVAGAFALRAQAWSQVLPGLGFGPAAGALHLGLVANHLLPFRMGEAVRPLAAARRTSVSLPAAVASTVVLRVADVATLLGLGCLAAPRIMATQLGWLSYAAPVVLAGAYLAGVRWLGRLPEQQAGLVRRPNATILAMTAAAWVLEAAVVWQTARWVGLPLSASAAMVVTAASVASQIAGVAPGGVGTYEAAAVAAYAALGHPADTALAAALITHGVMTAYSLLGGAWALSVRARRPAGSSAGRSS